MVEMALRCHHLAYRFLKKFGGEPPYPPSNPPLPKAAYGPMTTVCMSGMYVLDEKSIVEKNVLYYIFVGYVWLSFLSKLHS